MAYRQVWTTDVLLKYGGIAGKPGGNEENKH
jgi:hypothetical protein